MGLAAQWEAVSASLPDDWEQASLRLAVADESSRARAAALLGPLTPGRVGDELHFVVWRSAGIGPEGARRLLTRLEDEGIDGQLVLAGSAAAADEPATGPARAGLDRQWERLVEELPDDWSDLLCRVELASSDDLPRASLLAAPLNPSRPHRELGFDFRVARRFGFGASPQMARRCLARLDEAGVPGSVEILRALSDTSLLGTQGPVWYVGGKVL